MTPAISSNRSLSLPCLAVLLLGFHSAGSAWSSEGQAIGETPLKAIMFGSCAKQDKPMPIFQTIVQSKPDLFVFLGDNIYADTTDMSVMKSKYARLKANKFFAELLKTCPTMATWDDHDYGGNDAGADYPKRVEAQKLFLDFWGDAADSPRRRRAGVYDARIFGPPGKRVQVILLDTRYFRGPLKKGPRRVGGPYYPDNDERLTMLGSAQWKWLETELRRPAEIRLIASSIQLVSEAAGQETWSNMPRERTRLLQLIRDSKANGVIVISGDRHWAEISATPREAGYPIYDVTASSFNQLHSRGTPTTNRFRSLPKTYHRENFGAMRINWAGENTSLTIQIIDLQGKVQIVKRIALKELQAR